MPSSLSFRSVVTLLHQCDHFFLIAVASTNRCSTTMVYDSDQHRVRCEGPTTSCIQRHRGGEASKIAAAQQGTMPYHLQMTLKHGRDGFHWMTTFPTSRQRQKAAFFSNDQTIRPSQHHPRISVPPPQQKSQSQSHNQKSLRPSTPTPRISPPSQRSHKNNTTASRKWNGSTETQDNVRQTAGAKQQFPRVEKQRETGNDIRERAQQPRVGAHRSE